MRGSIVAAVVVALALSACGGDDDGGGGTLSADEKADVIQTVEDNWNTCFAAVGVSTDGATVAVVDGDTTGRPIDEGHRVAIVSIQADGYDPAPEFAVQLDGPLDGAATNNDEAEALLDDASAQGEDCG